MILSEAESLRGNPEDVGRQVIEKKKRKKKRQESESSNRNSRSSSKKALKKVLSIKNKEKKQNVKNKSDGLTLAQISSKTLSFPEPNSNSQISNSVNYDQAQDYSQKKYQDSTLNSYFKNSNYKGDSRKKADELTSNEIQMQEIILKLRKELDSQIKINQDQESIIANYKYKISELDNLNRNAKLELQAALDSKEQTLESLAQCLRELEEMKRAKQKEWVNNQGFKIGRLRMHSQGLGINHFWEDGVEVKNAQLELEQIVKDREEEKKAKKKINSANTDKLEEYKFKIEKLNKTEADIKSKLDQFYIERIKLEAEERRLYEESRCNYMKKGWPILNKRYLILSLIGKGGYSEVYKAYDLVSHIHVACKIHQLEQSWNENVKELYIRHTIRENQIYQKINHDKVVKYYDTVEMIDNNSFATVLELCSGPDLSFYLKQNGPLNEREARIIVKQIIIGLKELHKQGIIHYDLKPQNIIFHKGEVKISDFGLSKEMKDKDKIEDTCLGLGTYYYLPPETFDPNRSLMIDQKVDIWSVGIIFYELLFGKKPFGNNISQEKILKENLIWNSKPVDFPSESKLAISKETQVRLLILNV